MNAETPISPRVAIQEQNPENPETQEQRGRERPKGQVTSMGWNQEVRKERKEKKEKNISLWVIF